MCGHAALVFEGDRGDDVGNCSVDAARAWGGVSVGVVSRGVELRTARTLATCALEYTTAGRSTSSSERFFAFLKVRGEMKTDVNDLALLVSRRGVTVMATGAASCANVLLSADKKCVMLLVGSGEADALESVLRGDGSKSLSALCGDAARRLSVFGSKKTVMLSVVLRVEGMDILSAR
jgi:hypothetical protein